MGRGPRPITEEPRPGNASGNRRSNIMADFVNDFMKQYGGGLFGKKR